MDEEIAIVGVGCRFPGGAESAAAYWELLREGRDAVVDVPVDRWQHARFLDPTGAPGKTRIAQGAFLRGPVDRFDAAFFGISAREAEALDPQQRILLEVAWETFEHAGVVPASLRGSRTGVYVGCFTLDHLVLQNTELNARRLDLHSAVGSTLVMLANRLSYTFDLRGPSFALDTACSSSLVAVHQACQALRAGECDAALAGGVNLMIGPWPFVSLDRGGFLSPTHRCHAFDVGADGYVRGEGAGLVLLEPLSRARREGHEVLGVISATGCNQDGRTPGITLPSQEAQRALMREVWARVPALRERLAYIEAHGTGTTAGDQTEAAALSQALTDLGRERDRPCFVGSVKTNMGHLEGAAGVAGLIKAVLCLRERRVVPNLHLARPSIDLPALGLEVPTREAALPDDAAPVYAAINSFGYGGTNAHVVVRDAPAARPPAGDGACAGPFLLSAQSEPALRALAERWRDWLAGAPPARPLDVAFTAAALRQHHRHRLAVVAPSLEALGARLDQHLGGAAPGGDLAAGSLPVDAAPERPVFVYTGMGAQSWGMARDLVDDDPVVAAALARCDETWRPLAGWSLLELLRDPAAWAARGRAAGDAMGDPRHAQPANFALQVALTERWRAWGVEPAAIVGHSAGEYAAAWAAGALDLPEALRLLHARAELQQALCGEGTMLAVQGPLPRVREALQEAPDVVVAAFNGPTSVVLAGPRASLEELAAALEPRGLGLHWLRVDVPYHHPCMERLREAFAREVGEVRGRTPALPLYSSVAGKRREAALDLDHWWRNVVEPARFAPAVEAARKAGHRQFLELGPHPALSPAIAEGFAAARERVAVTSSLRRGAPALATLRAGLAQLFARGADVDWRRAFEGGRRATLPGYPWQGQRMLSESEASRRLYRTPDEHPLLQLRQHTPEPSWLTELRAARLPWLPDHRVFGRAVLPAAGSIAIALTAARALGRAAELREVRLESMFPVERGARCWVAVDPASGRFALHGAGLASQDDGHWTRHATGLLAERPRGREQARVDLAAAQARCAPVPADALYEAAKARGLDYGPAFRVVQQLLRGEGEVVAELRVADEHLDPTYPVHPALLDGAFQAVLALVDDDDPRAALPVEVRDLRLHAPVPARAWVRAVARSLGPDVREVDLVVCDDEGAPLVEVLGLRTRAVRAPGAEQAEGLVRERWEPAPPADAPRETTHAWWLVVQAAGAAHEALTAALRAAGQGVVVAHPERAWRELGPDARALDLAAPEQVERVLDLGAQRGFVGVVFVAAADPADPTGAASTLGLLHLVQGLERLQVPRRLRLVVATSGAHRVVPADPPNDPAARALWGLARTIRSELPNLSTRLVDLDPADAASARDLVAEALTLDDEDEVALRGGRRHVARLVRCGLDDAAVPVNAPAGTPARLVQTTPGRVEGLVFAEVERRAPGQDEVEVEVRVAALNFKDVLKAQGKLPSEYVAATSTGEGLGVEVAGVVVRVGPGVTAPAVGDEVVALAAPIATFATVPARLALPRPPVAWEASASLVNFATAHHALVELARVRPGERVLVHSATSGVGLAAVQVARRLGAEVVATAGTEAKRAHLRELGVEHVGDSRSLSFGPDVRRWTGGRGVDVVVNTLVGEALADGLELLAPGGRFVEVGKADILARGALPLAAFDRGLTFSAFDLDQPSAAPDLLRAATAAARGLAAGELAPLPTRAFPAAEVVEAFREAGRGEHVGKLVVRMDEGALPVRRGGAARGALLRDDATYLVTGAFGDLGRDVVRWLASAGARHLALVGRSGAATLEAQALLDELRAAGVEARVHAVDLADEAAVRALLAALDAGGPPLRGVFHLATAFRDAALVELDRASFEAVLGPKAAAAWWLHEATRERALDHFVLFSSISGLTGTAGQANYAAANAFLDGLAQRRRALGLPATSVSWGPVAGTKVVSQLLERGGALERVGYKALARVRLLAVLAQALRARPDHVACADLDWGAWARLHRGRHGLRRLERLVTLSRGDAQDEVVTREALLALPRERRQQLVETLLKAELGRVLGQSPDELDPAQKLVELGLDSMMYVELRAAVQERLGVDIQTGSRATRRTVREMAQEIDQALDAGPAEQEAPRG